MTSRRTLLWIALFALAKLAIHTYFNANYGFHRDELQTLDDARHLEWGFVAYPPLTPFLGRIELELFGTSLRGFRFLAAAAQSLVIILVALMARAIGGSTRAQWIAAISAAVGTISLAASSLFQYVSFDFLWFVVIAYCMVRLIETDDARWWIGIGTAIGLGVLTKYTIAFFVAGVVAAVFFTPALRRHLKSRWLWIGVAISVAIALPNLIWQQTHDWISLDFLRHIHARDVRIGRTNHFFIEQLYVAANPATIPVWIAGLAALIAWPTLRRFRPLLWMAVVPFVILVIAKGRGYYTGPIYPMLLAAGAVAIAAWLERSSANARRFATAALVVLLVGAVLFIPIVVPIVPISSPLWKKLAAINNDYREEIGWPELTQEVARIWSTIPQSERAHAAIFAGNYGEGGALNLYGPALGLPRAICATNSFWYRGYGGSDPQTIIILGGHREELERVFSSVVLAGRITNRWNVLNEETEDHPEIFICRGARRPLSKLWPDIRSFG